MNGRQVMGHEWQAYGRTRKLFFLDGNGGVRSGFEIPQTVFVSDQQAVHVSISHLLCWTSYSYTSEHVLVGCFLNIMSMGWPWFILDNLFSVIAGRAIKNEYLALGTLFTTGALAFGLSGGDKKAKAPIKSTPVTVPGVSSWVLLFRLFDLVHSG